MTQDNNKKPVKDKAESSIDSTAEDEKNLNFSEPDIEQLMDNISADIDSDTNISDPELDDGTEDAAVQYRLAELEFELTSEKMREEENRRQQLEARDSDDNLESIDSASQPEAKGLDAIPAKELTLEDGVDDSDTLECLNCATPLSGPYCHNCGQPDRHFIRFFPKVLFDMVNEAFDLDSRALRTLLPLFFLPGRLSMEYIAGRRARYVNPLRLYIVLSVLFFISISLFTDTENNLQVTDSNGVNTRVRTADESVSTDPHAEKKKVVELLKQKKAEGLPISDEAIAEAEKALTDLENNPTKSNSLDTGLVDDEGKLKVTIDADGNLWIGAHPKLLDFVSHAKDQDKHSASQILKLTPIADSDFQVTEVYLNDGSDISGSSTALYYAGVIYMGVVFENKLLSGVYP